MKHESINEEKKPYTLEQLQEAVRKANIDRLEEGKEAIAVPTSLSDSESGFRNPWGHVPGWADVDLSEEGNCKWEK